MELRDHVLKLAADSGYVLDDRILLELAADEPEAVREAINSAAAITANEYALDLLRQTLDGLSTKAPTWQLDDLGYYADALRRLDEAYSVISESLTDSRSEFRNSLRQLVGSAPDA